MFYCKICHCSWLWRNSWSLFYWQENNGWPLFYCQSVPSDEVMLSTGYNMLSTIYIGWARLIVDCSKFDSRYVVDNIWYVVRVSITAIFCGLRVLSCGCMLWTYILWVPIYCGYRLYVVGIYCGQHLLIVYVVGDGMLWVTCVHNICVCRPQHIYVVDVCCGVLRLLPMLHPFKPQTTTYICII